MNLTRDAHRARTARGAVRGRPRVRDDALLCGGRCAHDVDSRGREWRGTMTALCGGSLAIVALLWAACTADAGGRAFVAAGPRQQAAMSPSAAPAVPSSSPTPRLGPCAAAVVTQRRGIGDGTEATLSLPAGVQQITLEVAPSARGGRLMLPPPDLESVQRRWLAPPVLPPGPVRDAPQHPPRNGVVTAIETAVVGLVDLTLLPVSIPLSVATEGQVSPLFLPFPATESAVFSDAVLDDEAWRAEVQRRGEAWSAAAADWIRMQNELSSRGTCAFTTELGCTASTLIVDAPPMLRATVHRDGCPAETVDVPLHAPEDTSVDPSMSKHSAELNRQTWRRIDEATPAWADSVLPDQRALRWLYRTAKATPHVHELVEETLLCRVQARGRDWDPFRGAPDLTLRVSLGGTEVAGRSFRLPDDTADAVFLIPDMHLAQGERFKFSVVDRDAFEDDWGGAVWGIFSGELPLLATHARFTVGCRPVDGARAHRRFVESVQKVEAALSAQPAVVTMNASPHPQRVVRQRLVAAATYGGWDRAPLRGLLRQYEEQREERRRQTEAALARSIPLPQVLLDDVEILQASLEPLIRLEMRTTSGKRLDPVALAREIRLIDDEGFGYALVAFPEHESTATSQGDISLTFRVKDELMGAPAALWLKRQEQAVWIRSR